MQVYMIAVRAVIAYVYLLFIVRATGKRTIGQASPMDFVVALIIGDMVDDLLWAEVSAAKFAVAVGALAAVHVLMSIACCRSERITRLVEGVPQPILRQGSPDHEGLKAERVGSVGYGCILRCLELDDLREAETVQIEVSGEASVIKAEWAKEAQRADWERCRAAQEAQA
jgi:uncharacterized membrane protein YcaP (DUF421 family)